MPEYPTDELLNAHLERDLIEALRNAGVDPEEIDDPPLQALEFILRIPLRISATIEDPVLRSLARCVKAHKTLIRALGRRFGNPYVRALRAVLEDAGRPGGKGDARAFRSLVTFFRNAGVDPDEIDDPPLGLLESVLDSDLQDPQQIEAPVLRGLVKFLKAHWALVADLKSVTEPRKPIGNPFLRALDISLREEEIDRKAIDDRVYDSLVTFLRNAGVDPDEIDNPPPPPTQQEVEAYAGGPLEENP